MRGTIIGLGAIAVVLGGAAPAAASSHHHKNEPVHHDKAHATHAHKDARHKDTKHGTKKHEDAKHDAHKPSVPSGSTSVPAGGIKLYCGPGRSPLMVRKMTQGAGTTVTVICR